MANHAYFKKKNFTPLLSDFSVFWRGFSKARKKLRKISKNTFYKIVIEFLLQSKTA
jgi:hypothetical protein